MAPFAYSGSAIEADETLRSTALKQNECGPQRRPLASHPSETHGSSVENPVAALFDSLSQRYLVLVGVLSYCSEPKPAHVAESYADDLQRYDNSVFDGATLCRQLYRAGALSLVDAEGAPFSEGQANPATETVDDVDYLVSVEPAPAYWLTTPAGAAYLAENGPDKRLRAALDADERYKVIYKRILSLCAREEGASTAYLAYAVNDDPLLQNPRRYCTKFTDVLRQNGALFYDTAWKVTETGRRLLSSLADVEDAWTPGRGASASPSGSRMAHREYQWWERRR